MSRQPWSGGRLVLVIVLGLVLALVLALMAARAHQADQADCEAVQVTDQGVICTVGDQQLDLTIR